MGSRCLGQRYSALSGCLTSKIRVSTISDRLKLRLVAKGINRARYARRDELRDIAATHKGSGGPKGPSAVRSAHSSAPRRNDGLALCVCMCMVSGRIAFDGRLFADSSEWAEHPSGLRSGQHCGGGLLGLFVCLEQILGFVVGLGRQEMWNAPSDSSVGSAT